jgi:hypothetical protein
MAEKQNNQEKLRQKVDINPSGVLAPVRERRNKINRLMQEIDEPTNKPVKPKYRSI